MILTEMRQKFRGLYGSDARIYRAPGRVNLIGEHTDYNDGFVMPAGIDFYIYAAIAPRRDRKLLIHSENFSDSIEIDLDDVTAGRANHWSNYVRGVAVVLEREGHRLSGANLLIRGEVPIGSGLSSSAAIEVACGYAMLDVAGIAIDRAQLAQICQRAENEFAGARCGIMDQFISCCGHEGHALMLDCRSLDYKLFRIAKDVKLVICNTMVKHEHAGGEYNARRAECEAGLRLLKRAMPNAVALRDVTMDELERYGSDMPEVIYKRCRHVISENNRVLEAAAALERGDLNAFGQLMAQSHRSLRDDYEVSCVELDTLVEMANRQEGIYGSRMTGGGFGGCTINLVKAENVAEFEREIARGYEQATGRVPEIYICNAAEGAHQVVTM